MNWKEVGDWAFYIAAFAAVTFVALYAFLAPWWRTNTGRNIMALMGTMALAFVYFAWVIRRGGVPTYFYPIRALLFALLGVTIMHRVVILVRSQIMSRKEVRHEQARQVR